MFLLNFSSSDMALSLKQKQENSIEKLLLNYNFFNTNFRFFFNYSLFIYINFLQKKLILKKLIVFGAFYFITNELVNIIIIHLKTEGKSARYSIIKVFSY